MLSVSVVICAYTEKRWQDLQEAISSIKRQSHPLEEIIVVIDHNPDLLQKVRDTYADIVVIKNSNERGLSGARNSGIAIATGDIIAFMDEDAIAERNWIAALHSGYQDTSSTGVGGSILPLWEKGRPTWFPTEFDWVVGCTYHGMPEKAAFVRNLIGCNMSFRREVFNLIGGFRQGMGRLGVIPLGCEETELCIRSNLLYQKDTLLYDPRARVFHRVPQSRATIRYFISRCFSEGISKSQVSHWVGAARGLSNEREYTYHTLPAAIRQGLQDFFTSRKLAGLMRSFAILLGLSVTTLGYIYGNMKLAIFGGNVARSHTRLNNVESGSIQDH